MFKLLLIFFIGYIIYRIVRAYQSQLPLQENKPKPPQIEDMVRCDHCKVHLPRSESIIVDDKFYCCEEHRQSAP